MYHPHFHPLASQRAQHRAEVIRFALGALALSAIAFIAVYGLLCTVGGYCF